MVLTECAVLGVFVIGLLVSRHFKRRWHVTEIMTMYALGLLLEVLTAHMWTYHNVFLLFDFRVAHDISVLFPLGWAGLIMIATPIAESAWRRWNVGSWWSRHLVLVVVWLMVGDTSETIFYNLGMIEYVRNDATEMNFLLGQLPRLPPTMILLVGFGVLLPLVSHFFRWMERSLVRRATRPG